MILARVERLQREGFLALMRLRQSGSSNLRGLISINDAVFKRQQRGK
ncbi:MAG: hypothetical protein PVG20_10005 [Thioalkalispiraceae bacterium]